jgi:YfiH family protein
MLSRRSGLLDSLAVAHGFFGRRGGVSEGFYASLNCGPGSQDSPDAVRENRRRALAELTPLPSARLVTCYQIHSPQAVTVAEPWEIPQNPKADAMATDRPGIALGILAADCAPILLADPDRRVVGAAHAGWGGAFGGVVESVVFAMEGLGADRDAIRAAIGPCIGQAAYEVGPEFEERFRTADPDNGRFFRPSARASHWQFDLESYVAARLSAAGITRIEKLGLCTYTNASDYFSYRRTTHAKEPDYGRQLSAIMLLE